MRFLFLGKTYTLMAPDGITHDIINKMFHKMDSDLNHQFKVRSMATWQHYLGEQVMFCVLPISCPARYLSARKIFAQIIKVEGRITIY